MPNLTAMTQKEFIARVENGDVLGGYTNLIVFNYYAKQEMLTARPTNHFAIVADGNVKRNSVCWRVVYKFSMMDYIHITDLMTLGDAKASLAEMMFDINK